MAATKYTYSIQDDFLNHKVSSDSLILEVQSSAIIVALDYINTSGDDCDVWFKDALSPTDSALLDSIVAAHEGEPLPDPVAPDGSTLVTTVGSGSLGGRVGALHMDSWSGTPATITSSFETVHENTTGGVLYDVVWQTNSTSMEVRVSLDGLAVLQVEFGELSDLQLDKDDSDSGVGPCWDWIHAYGSRRWRFRPPEPIEFSTFTVEFRLTSGKNKRVERGMTIWRGP